MISNGRIFSPTSVKVFPSPAGKTPVYLTPDLELCVMNHSQARPTKTSSSQLMFFTSTWAIREESSVQTWVQSTCTYVKESCLRKLLTNCTVHISAKIGQPVGQWSWTKSSSGKRQLAPPHNWSTCIFLLKCMLQVSLSTQQIAKLYLSHSMSTFSNAQRLADAHVRSKSLGRKYPFSQSLTTGVTYFENSPT